MPNSLIQYNNAIDDSLIYSSSSFGGVQVWMIIATILSIIGGILVYFLFVKAKGNPKNKFLVWLKGFLDFKSMWLEVILKISYYFLTIL